MPNHLMLAVAGSRKTQGIVEHCASLPAERRALVVTYTQNNQLELRHRLSKYAGDRRNIEIMGWFTFLLRHFARPFIPFKFPSMRIRGFNFDGRPHMMATGSRRFLDKNSAVFACELGRLAHELVGESKGALLRRLECIYDEILIDEVQDFSSHDWDVVDALLDSSIDVRMVGDIRQAVLSTNPRSLRNKKFSYVNSINWFREREASGRLVIEESTVTWRCHPAIAKFSDTIFDQSWKFPSTVSCNPRNTGHDGMFLVHAKDVEEYANRFSPACLRYSSIFGKNLKLDFVNFKIAKGSTYEHVLVVPTKPIEGFLQKGTLLTPSQAASFYVAITRAAQSVAIVLDSPGGAAIDYWRP